MNISDATFVVVDTETTGLDPAKDGLLEIAAVAVSRFGGVHGMWATRVNPGIAIPPEASAIHHIRPRHIADAPTPREASAKLNGFEMSMRGAGTDACVIAAHNLDFDGAFLAPQWPWLARQDQLCTERLAHHLWPSAPNFKNGTLRYWRDLEVDTYGIPSHRALSDALVTAELLRDELTCSEFEARNIADVDALVRLAASPYVVQRWPFGKYYQQPIEDAPMDYVAWALRLPDLSRDLRYTLEQRRKAA